MTNLLPHSSPHVLHFTPHFCLQLSSPSTRDTRFLCFFLVSPPLPPLPSPKFVYLFILSNFLILLLFNCLSFAISLIYYYLFAFLSLLAFVYLFIFPSILQPNLFLFTPLSPLVPICFFVYLFTCPSILKPNLFLFTPLNPLTPICLFCLFVYIFQLLINHNPVYLFSYYYLFYLFYLFVYLLICLYIYLFYSFAYLFILLIFLKP